MCYYKEKAISIYLLEILKEYSDEENKMILKASPNGMKFCVRQYLSYSGVVEPKNLKDDIIKGINIVWS